ncbi:MAG: DUF1778 domain-containing protein [Coriobacteriales bacterium]|jgi:hypothetical protein|nr:DUF1778 domain-containing protein [Coriobacteriales bacterium]
MARPKTVTPKTAPLAVRLTVAERQAIKAAAAASGVSLSEFLRSSALDVAGDYYPLGSGQLIAAMRELSNAITLAGNRNSQGIKALNRIAYGLEEGFSVETISEDLAHFVSDTKPLIIATQQEIKEAKQRVVALQFAVDAKLRKAGF